MVNGVHTWSNGSGEDCRWPGELRGELPHACMYMHECAAEIFATNFHLYSICKLCRVHLKG